MESVESILSQMSLEEKIGQLMMVGFNGTSPSAEIVELIAKCRLGGVILFARNVESPEQTARLNSKLQNAAKENGVLPLFISTDQEGGTVVRLAAGASVSPGNMALGAARSEELALDTARVMANELRSVGINVNLAPCLDVNNNPKNPVIGLRSFGEDPGLVARLGTAQIRGYQENGVVAVAKHFPGHGDTDTDSHLALPVVGHSRERLFSVELRPFREAIEAGVEAIMTAHVVFPAFEPDPSIPATLSYGVLTTLLRDELGFDGLVMTDCMEMKAIADNFGSEEAAVRTIEAGADMVLVSHTPKTQWASYRGLLEAVRSGRLTEERITDSVRRVLRAKERFGLLKFGSVLEDQVKDRVGTPENLAVVENAARKAITLVKNDGVVPIGRDVKVLVVDETARARTVAEEVALAVSTVGNQLTRVLEDVEVFMVDIKPSNVQIAEAVRKAEAADIVVVATQDAHRWQGQTRMVNELISTGKPVVVMGLRTPYDLQGFPEVSAYIACYGYQEHNIRAGVDVLVGRAKPVGKLPVSIPGLYSAGHGLELGD